MPDPNLTIPAGSMPLWLVRYNDRRIATHERRAARYSHRWPALRTRRTRRALVTLLMLTLLVAVASSIATFWQLAAATPVFLIATLGSLIPLTLIRITNDAVADAPAQALDEIQLAQRNAARSLTYVLLIPTGIAIFLVTNFLGHSEYVAGETVTAVGWLFVAALLSLACLPDILLTWWLPDDEQE
ncbi:hypothetical protein [Gordonia alkaliphila]|uniref:Uncharacterized protein n=1 Tax=Gordonia alkaliphila TaxID=1053547 RepID=A0ABP8YYC6_9ACTN